MGQFITENRVFGVAALFTLTVVIGAVAANVLWLMVLPLAIIVGLLFVIDLKWAYLLLVVMLPFSIEFPVTASLATDLPTEPLMILLMLCLVLYFIMHPQRFSRKFIKHPIIVFLLLHLVWIAISAVYSQIFIVSFKFLLAKTWYVASFVMATSLFVKDYRSFKPVFWCLVIPLTFTVVYTLANHASMDFSFIDVNRSMKPFFRNHVNYAVMLAIVFPFLVQAKQWYKKGSIEQLVLGVGMLLFFLGIVFAYTRAAYISLFIMPFIYWAVKYRLIRWGAWFGLGVMALGMVYMLHNNNYLAYAPDFEKTIYHEDLDEHFASTMEGEDLSTMERVYRWVAAVRMSSEHPIMGFGPGNFYNFYKSYTVNAFQTYVSDNEEQSGVHNYFLMVLVDQGVIGLVLFLLFCVVTVIKGETIYHATKGSEDRALVMAALVSIIVIMVNLLVSDMIEVDKIGTIFFMNIAILVNYGIK